MTASPSLESTHTGMSLDARLPGPGSGANLLIRPVLATEIDDVRALLAASGWEHRSADLQRLDELIARSQLALVAVEEGTGVVGFVRALTDGLSNGYISMLAVRESHRQRGIGSELVRRCMGENEDMTWVLRAGRPGLFGFYEKLGFKMSSVALERPRRAKAGSA